MKRFIFTLLSLGMVVMGFTQQRVALHSNGFTSIYGGADPLSDAFTDAVDGDTIYIPGGVFNTPNPFDKRIVLIGTGIHVDSTQATAKTRMNGISFRNGSGGSHIEGIWFNSGLSTANDHDVDSLLIRRCYINGDIIFNGSDPATVCEKVRIEENVIDGNVQAGHTDELKLFNNLLHRLYHVATNAWIANNIFRYDGSYALINVHQSLLENNYFESSYSGIGMNNTDNNTFMNNIFSHNGPATDLSNTYVNSYYPFSMTDIFVDPGNYTDFETYDFHLQDPATYQGTTGDEVGIYGGHSPVKEGWVPFNPHIRSVTVAPNTDPAGQLSIDIQVGAQNN